MPPKKKPAKAAKKPVKKAASQKAPKKLPKSVNARTKKPAPKAQKPVVKPKLPPHAKKMALFSQRVVEEEAAPVAVRTFNEARAGIEESKRLDVRSGQVKPVGSPQPAAAPPQAGPASTPTPRPPPVPLPKQPEETDEDLEAEIERDLSQDFVPPPTSKPGAASRPQIQPLAGEIATPKRANPFDEEFKIGAPAKKGKKGAPPTKEDLGKIELRMQRGSKDEAIAHASPDYLQRSFNQATQKGRVAATTSTKGDETHKPDEFHVAMDKGKKRFDAALTDFGDVEVAQQTRRGSKKVGKLDTDEESDEQTS